jgi:hypothetical protein
MAAAMSLRLLMTRKSIFRPPTASTLGAVNWVTVTSADAGQRDEVRDRLVRDHVGAGVLALLARQAQALLDDLPLGWVLLDVLLSAGSSE